MKKLLVLGCFLTMLWACRTGKPAMVSSSDSTQSEIRTKYVEIIKDSTVFIDPDSSLLQALLACDSNGQVMLKNLLSYQNGKHAKVPEVAISNNKLTVKSRVDSFSIYFWWKLTHASSDSSHYREKKTVITMPPERVNYVTGWQHFFIKSGQVLWVALIVMAAYKVLKHRLTIIQKVRKWVA